MTYYRGKKTSTAVPGDRRPLRNYRLTQLFSRTLFFLELTEPRVGIHRYAVDVNYEAEELAGGDPHEEDAGSRDEAASPVALYRDGIQIHRSDLPAVFPVPGGHIEVATRMYGLSRMHYVHDDGAEHVLRPHPQSPEGLRAAFARRAPRASRAAGQIAAVVLLAGLVVTLPQGLAAVTELDFIAERIGSFTSPIRLPAGANSTLIVATALAGIERALTLRQQWLIDLDSTWSDDE